MATALDVISLQNAKDFLVIDFPDRDPEIERHIKAAVSFVEKYTCHILYQRPASYQVTGKNDCYVEIYEYPITFTDTTIKKVNEILSVKVYVKSGVQVLTTIGYATVDLIPTELVEACYKLIQYLTENKDIYGANLPWDIQMMINKYRRSPTI